MTELIVARTPEELCAHLAQRVGQAEARNLAVVEQRRAAGQTEEDVAPEAPRVATVGLVPTMGALHEGHATLIRRAREQNDVVVVSIFVNPLQFGPGEDYDRYPRTPEADLELLRGIGVDLAFVPEVQTLYPGSEPLVRVTSGRLGELFEGARRPGHFDGVLTVVNKLLNITASGASGHPVRAYFGQKDAQQVALVQRMVADFALPVTVVPVAIVRDDDGLALSSRNAYLSAEERTAALVLSRTLALLREEGLSRGYAGIDLEAARQRIEQSDGVELDYLEIVDPETFEPPTEDSPRALALAAIRVGSTRLLDNMDVV